MTATSSTDRLGGPAVLHRGTRATRAKRSLAEFARQAIEAGVVEGIKRVEWGPHLDALCSQTQLQLEAWLVAYDLGTPDMIARQRAAWERTGATWEDGDPEPWLRYVLTQNVLTNCPPGTLKSTIVMVIACAWIWLWCPWFAFGASSGIDANVKRDSDACRELVKSAWYCETFEIAWVDEDVEPDLDEIDEDTGITIRHDAASVSDWKTTRGGRRISRTIGRGFTGAHVDGIYLDDPDDADKVWNEPARIRPQLRFDRAIRNRVNCDHRSIRNVQQQVVHPQGFSAHLLSLSRWSPTTPKGWAWLCIPAEYGFGPEDAPEETPYGWRDWRRNKGEVLHQRLSPGVLADYRENTPGYEGQYNQNAERQVDGILARANARFFVFEGENVALLRKRPLYCPDRAAQPPIVIRPAQLTKRTLSVDAANSLDPKPGANVSSVGLTVAANLGEARFVLDDRTRVLGVGATYLGIFELIGAWELDEILVEIKAMGPSVIYELTLAIRRGWRLDPETDERIPILGPDGKPPRCQVKTYNPGKDSKLTRAQGVVGPWNDGLVFLRDGAPWLYPRADSNRRTVDPGYIGDVCSYTGPGSGRTDRMDSLSQFVAHNRVVVQQRASAAPIALTVVAN